MKQEDTIYQSIFLPPVSCSTLKFLCISTVTSFPDSHFDMSSLDRLEKVAGVAIFSELDEELPEMASVLDLCESTRDTLSKENGMEEGSKTMMEAWLSGESPLSPTWQVLLKTLQAVNKEELAQEIEFFFNRISVTSPSLPLVSYMPVYQIGALYLNALVHSVSFSFFQTSDTKKKDLGLGLSEIESKEQQTKPDCRAVAVQNSPNCQEVAVQNSPYYQEVAVQNSPDYQEVAVQNSPDCQEVAVQNSPNCQEVAVQTHSEPTVSKNTSKSTTFVACNCIKVYCSDAYF